jgi:benzodiazapine receptor
MHEHPFRRLPDVAALAAWILLSFVAASSGALWPLGAWYAEIVKPTWMPPGWLFGPVWTVLYAMMGTSAWRVWRVGGFRTDRAALALFLLQWMLNFAWTGIFFGAHAMGLALIEIIVLLAAIAATAWRFRQHDRVAATLLVPYLLWVTFATALNFALWQLN